MACVETDGTIVMIPSFFHTGGMGNSTLASMDISDATGNDSHQINQEMIQIISDQQGWAPQLVRAAQYLVGSQNDVGWDTEDDKEHHQQRPNRDEPRTQKSSHMGIGIGFELLCIRQAFCAYLAGIGPESIAIYGDDSVTLGCKSQHRGLKRWIDTFYSRQALSGKTVDTRGNAPEPILVDSPHYDVDGDRVVLDQNHYNGIRHKWDLPDDYTPVDSTINLAKSYIGLNKGVFCENQVFEYSTVKTFDHWVTESERFRKVDGGYMYRQRKNFAVCIPLMKLGQAGLKRGLNMQSANERPNIIGTAVALKKATRDYQGYMSKATNQLLSKSVSDALSGNHSGHTAFGGNGQGRSNWGQLFGFIENGTPKTTRREGELYTFLCDSFDGLQTKKGVNTIPQQEVKTVVGFTAERLTRYAGTPPVKMNLTREQCIKESNRNEVAGWSAMGMNPQSNHSSNLKLTKEQKSTACRLVKSSLTFNRKAKRRICTSILRSSGTPSKKVCRSVVRERNTDNCHYEREAIQILEAFATRNSRQNGRQTPLLNLKHTPP
jgi:hypothetical protein